MIRWVSEYALLDEQVKPVTREGVGDIHSVRAIPLTTASSVPWLSQACAPGARGAARATAAIGMITRASKPPASVRVA